VTSKEENGANPETKLMGQEKRQHAVASKRFLNVRDVREEKVVTEEPQFWRLP